MPKNGEDWGILIVAKGFKKLPKVQDIAQSGHTARNNRSQCCKQILEYHIATYAEIQHSNWFKLVTLLAAANQSAIFQKCIVTLGSLKCVNDWL